VNYSKDDIDSEGNEPVTIIINSKARKGKIDEFEEWMDGIIHESMKFEGHMGVNVIRPIDLLSNPEYVIIFRFNTYKNLTKWQNSEIRKEWLKKSAYVTEGARFVQNQTGLEFWFTPPHNTGQHAIPPRYKMAIVTGGVLFALLSSLVPLIRQATSMLPQMLSILVVVIIMVPLMTYVLMPPVTKLLRPWLSKKTLF
jgi:antibiotic biosynthesis monooxygenase (ABM) superfamily enzyme